jgi:hypothetical protein
VALAFSFILANGEFAPLFVVLVVVVGVGLAILGHMQARKRREELAALAESLGLRFDPDKDHGIEDRFGQFSCLRQGSRRYAFNILEGTYNNRQLCGFDYHYETYSTDSKGRRQTHHHYFSAVVVNSGLPLKPLAIRPEGFFDKVTEFFGYDDIDFELNEFSRRFYVKSPDKKWAFDVLHQETMEFMLHAPTFSLEFTTPWVIAYRSSTFKAKDFEAAVAVVEGILDRLPKYLLRELKGVDV